jgi:hypothetical protein
VRWSVLAIVIAGCDQGERAAPPPPQSTPAPSATYGADSFIEVYEVTVTDMDAPPDPRRIRITGDGTLEDKRDQHEVQHRAISPRRFAELAHELEAAGFLKLSHCMELDHGRHTMLTLSVPEGHNRIGDATTCDALRAPIHHILDLADAP